MKTHKNNEVVIVEGFRTPFVRFGHHFRDMPAEELGVYLLKELLERTQIANKEIEEIILSNTTSSPNISNIAHTIASGVGLPFSIPATTMRTMSAIEPLISSVIKIKFGVTNTLIAGGVESISNLPILLKSHLTKIIKKIAHSKTWKEKAKHIFSFQLSDIFLKFTDKALFRDPIFGMSQGQIMEKLSKDFHISREEQDKFALISSQKACLAQKNGKWKEEVVPVFPPTDFELIEQDIELENEVSMRYLSELKPCFDPDYGTVTSGNSSFPADGAVLFLIMNKEKAKSLGYSPLATIHSFASISVTPNSSCFPPVYAVEKLLKQEKLSIQDIDLLEIDETFSAKALAFLKAFDSTFFAGKQSESSVGKETWTATDTIANTSGNDIETVNTLETTNILSSAISKKYNVNGGALALGNALSAGSARMVLSLAKELRRKKGEWGLVVEGAQNGQGKVILLKNAL